MSRYSRKFTVLISAAMFVIASSMAFAESNNNGSECKKDCSVGKGSFMNTVSTVSDQPAHAIVSQRTELRWFNTTPGERMALRIRSRDVGGAFTIVEAQVPPLSGPPLHMHKDREEIFEVLEGVFRFRSGSETFDVSPGTSVVIPRGVVHAWANLGPKPGRIMFTFVPGGIDDFFDKIGQTAPEGWVTLSEQYDTWIVGPPLQIKTGK